MIYHAKCFPIVNGLLLIRGKLGCRSDHSYVSEWTVISAIIIIAQQLPNTNYMYNVHFRMHKHPASSLYISLRAVSLYTTKMNNHTKLAPVIHQFVSNQKAIPVVPSAVQYELPKHVPSLCWGIM